MKKLIIFVTFIFTFCLSGESVGGEWVSMGQLLGVDGYVNKILVRGDYIYFGGNFSSAGDIKAQNIARHNLKTGAWEAFGNGVDGEVTALTFDGNGNLYVGGGFYNAGFFPAQYLAKWDGENWAAIENCEFGKFEEISALVVDKDGSLIVAGTYSAFGEGTGGIVDGLMTCDGESAKPIGDFRGHVNDVLLDDDGNLYVAGYCEEKEGEAYCGLGKWDGKNWTLLGGKGFSRDEIGMTINTITQSKDGNIYVGGLFSQIGDVEAENIAMWDGKEWTALGNGVAEMDYGDGVQTIAFGKDGTVYAGGFIENSLMSNMAKWSGHQWTRMLDNPSNAVKSIFIDLENDDIYIGGYFTAAGLVTPSGLKKWTEQGWEDLGKMDGQLNDYVNELAVDLSGNVFAVGSFNKVNDKGCDGIAKWNGVSWDNVPHDFVGSFHGIEIDNSNRIIVGGDFKVLDSDEFNNIAIWDGKKWDSLSGGVEMYVYSILADENGNIYVGGQQRRDSAEVSSIIKIWDGEEWNDIELERGVEVTDGDFDKNGVPHFAVLGSFQQQPIDSCVYKIVDFKTEKVGETVPSVIMTLAFNSRNELYVGGSFNKEKHDAVADHLAKLEGSNWVPVASEVLDKTVYVISFDEENHLYAGGGFDKAGDLKVNNIARWDGTKWQSFQNGLGEMVNDIIFDKNGDMIAGGYFLNAGNVVSPYAAKFVFSNESGNDSNNDSSDETNEDSDIAGELSDDENESVDKEENGVLNKEGDGCSCSVVNF